MPSVTRCRDDNYWGEPGFSKKVFVKKSLTRRGGFASVDKVIDRVDDKYWKFEVSEFQSWMPGFSKFVGEWQTAEIEEDKIVVEYAYTLHSDIPLPYPLNWLFTKVFWKTYMKRVLENVRQIDD